MAFRRLITLEMGEIWGLKPTLQLVIPGSPGECRLRIVAGTCDQPAARGRDGVERSLRERQPGGSRPGRRSRRTHIGRMDFESRDGYRNAIAELAKHSARTEQEVAEAAVELAREALRCLRWFARRREPQLTWDITFSTAACTSLRAASVTHAAPRPSTRDGAALSHDILSGRHRSADICHRGISDFRCGHVHSPADRAVAAASARHADGGRFHEPSGDVTWFRRAHCRSWIFQRAFRRIARPWWPYRACC